MDETCFGFSLNNIMSIEGLQKYISFWDMNNTLVFILNLDKVLLKKLFPTMNG